MEQTWRWFGPDDKVSLADIRQAGAAGIVTVLHPLSPGAPWTESETAYGQARIAEGFDGAIRWQVVESLPVPEETERLGPSMAADIAAYQATQEALAAAGLQVICSNVMPALVWAHTDLCAPLDHGGRAMRFDLTRLVVFDDHILGRAEASESCGEDEAAVADCAVRGMNDAEIEELVHTAGTGLPSLAKRRTLEGLRLLALVTYGGVDAARLRQAHVDFLSEAAPLAEELGLRLCCHPDDPPVALSGLPRAMSRAEDYARLRDAVDNPAVGTTLCTGSLGAPADDNPVEIVRRFGSRIHFAHLDGQTEMVAVIAVKLEEETLHRTEGRKDAGIPGRLDHGREILSELTAGAQPGYPAVGHLNGLAELRGVTAAFQAHPQRRAA
ncbi:MAG: mannonate dehydratase [Pseudomonadota bacterium]